MTASTVTSTHLHIHGHRTPMPTEQVYCSECELGQVWWSVIECEAFKSGGREALDAALIADNTRRERERTRAQRNQQFSLLMRRTRVIWLIVYAFIAGLQAGQGRALGVAMIIFGALAVTWWVRRLEVQLLAIDAGGVKIAWW